MRIGIVSGAVWSTKKAQSFTGQIFLRVRCGTSDVIAADLVGAGVGEWVLVCFGSAARHACGSTPVDAAIVGIIDEQEEKHGDQ